MITQPTPTEDALLAVSIYYTNNQGDLYIAFSLDIGAVPFMEDSDFAAITAIYDARALAVATEGTTTRHVKFTYASSDTTSTIIS